MFKVIIEAWRFFPVKFDGILNKLARMIGNLSFAKIRVYKGLLKAFMRTRLRKECCRYSTASKIHNIGVLAHVDAGKTTTVERMLFYSGCTSSLGDVDKGSAVMDYLPMERERGITIKSAAIWFMWNGHRINFIDTPGHADFVFEVERALSVMNGAVVLLDAISGIEAQTVHVWRRASRWKLPRIIFINKMDRPDVDPAKIFTQVQRQFGVRLVPMQVPIFDNGSGANDRFCGLIDIISMEAFLWHPNSDGTVYTRQPLEAIPNKKQLKQAADARIHLVETLTEVDEALIDAFLNSGSNSLHIDSNILGQAVRRATLSNFLIPVFYGSSLKNIGIQLLLDAMVTYLPSSEERSNGKSLNFISTNYLELLETLSFIKDASKNLHKTENQSEDAPIKYRNISLMLNSLASSLKRKDISVFAIVFKVIVNRGIRYVYVAVHQGCLQKGQWLRLLRGGRVRVEKLRECIGGEAVLGSDSIHPRSFSGIGANNTGSPINRIDQGNWGIMISNDRIRTGDIFVDDSDINMSMDHTADVKIQTIFDGLIDSKTSGNAYLSLELPSPVVSIALEPIGAEATRSLPQVLSWLLDEDPSLRVDDNQGQILLSGIGELHIAAACDRLTNHFRLNIRTGSVQIQRREKILNEVVGQQTYHATMHKEIPVDVVVRLKPVDNPGKLNGIDNEIIIDECVTNEYKYLGIEKVEHACTAGVLAGLQSGPIKQLPISGAKVTVESINTYGITVTPSILGAAVRFAVLHVITTLPSQFVSIVEPIMYVVITLPRNEDIGNVIKDLTGLRQGKLISINNYSTDYHVLIAYIPLKHMLQYTT
ncbi:translation elongation factor G [Pneumocystis carinii B80]|uniref:Translation elongation factor G n=1 Tax=Pneumocystis carinii (strain B80) TaxID=1408658 RepID=A0A0W4ZC55_PNEC8|nr:translation elongation factor G [Pneumocystis carinii B80]KTW25857.1 translation elongation factor G [Pneumocystis carinii B80]